MDIVSFSIKKPVTILVGIILVILFGVISLQTLPYQLSPTVVEPIITVTTTWRGATPYEMEREIIEEQEKTLKGIPGLTEMESEAFNGQGSISLTFKLGTNVDDALLRVSNKLNEVPSYPEGVDKPIINATGAATSPVIWIILKSNETNPRHIETYRTFFENEVRQHLERVEGVADLFIGSGVDEEMHIIVRPEQLAAYGLTINDAIQAVRRENVNVSAGNRGVGRSDFRIRTTGEFNDEEDIASVVLVATGEKRVTLADVAQIERGYSKRDSTVIHNGKGGIAVGVKPEPGTNILAMTERVQDVVDWLNAEKLAAQDIKLEWVYDQHRPAHFSAQHQVNPCGCNFYPDKHHRHLYLHECYGAEPECSQPGGHRFCSRYARG
jgi:HAE1 family hydrophobic/amphiphilic exporter-1